MSNKLNRQELPNLNTKRITDSLIHIIESENPFQREHQVIQSVRNEKVVHHSDLELVALISAYSGHTINSTQPVSDQKLYDFWKQNVNGLQLYLSYFDKIFDEKKQKSGLADELFENVTIQGFHRELLLRVWCTILLAADRHQNQNHYSQVARSVMSGQLVLRSHLLEALTDLAETETQLVQKLNDLRKSLEHYTDLILGHISTTYDLFEYTHERTRAVSYGMKDLATLLETDQYSPWDSIMMRSEMLGLMELTNLQNADHYRLLKGSILRCFPDSSWTEEGMFKPAPRLTAKTLDPQLT